MITLTMPVVFCSPVPYSPGDSKATQKIFSESSAWVQMKLVPGMAYQLTNHCIYEVRQNY